MSKEDLQVDLQISVVRLEEQVRSISQSISEIKERIGYINQDNAKKAEELKESFYNITGIESKVKKYLQI